MKNAGKRAVSSLTTPLPDRWRPFSAFLGGLLILVVLAISGRYNGDAWRFFLTFTAVAAALGAVWAWRRSRHSRSAAR